MTTVATCRVGVAGAPKGLDVGLWAAQGLLCLAFAGAGVWKLFTPVAELAATFSWMGQVPAAFVRATGVVDVLGGVGVLLPAVARVRPGLAAWAGLGCAALQACAIAFHVSRGEAADTPFNFFLAALAAFVFWGRRFKAPVSARA